MEIESTKGAEIILPEDDKAAFFREDIKGWVSRTGRFFGIGQGAEEVARTEGATHKKCERCQKIYEKTYYSVCWTCHSVIEQEKYHRLETKDWDGESPMYSESHHRWFFDLEDIYEYLAELNVEAEKGGMEERTLEDLRLMIAVKSKFHAVDPYDQYCDLMPENCEELPKKILDAFEELNMKIKEFNETDSFSWDISGYRLNLESIHE